MTSEEIRRAGYLKLGAYAVFFILLTFRLDAIPPPWWDEGWTMSVAKNLVTSGHFGHLRLGQPIGPELSGHAPTVLLAALGFKIFGVGVWQARAGFVIATLLFMSLFSRLVDRLFSPGIAGWTLIALAFFPLQWDLVPQLIGRQVLGEMPVLLCIVLGLYLLERSEGNHLIAMAGATFMFALALVAKSQFLPFLLIGLLVPVVVLFHHRWHEWLTMLAVLVGSLVVAQGLMYLGDILLLDTVSPETYLLGTVKQSAFVFDRTVRMATFRFVLVTGLPATAALYFALHRFRFTQWGGWEASWQDAVRLVLYCIVTSWFLWYVTLSIGWGRYLIPAAMLSMPFVIDLIREFFEGVTWLDVLPGIKEAFAKGRIGWPLARMLAGCAIVALLLRQTIIGIGEFRHAEADTSWRNVAAFLNTKTPAGCTIETYESELLFLLDRPVHFPPAQLSHDVILNDWTSDRVRYAYDVSHLAADYLVVGAFGRQLYTDAIVSGMYRQVKAFGRYTVYEKFVPARP
jgi:hypothetical protein